MIEPALADDELLEDIRQASAETERPHWWWLGQSGFLLKWRGRHLLLDPYLSDSLTKKYAATDRPHVRMTRRVIDPVRLDFIDVVTSSHNHTDHLDAETLLPLLSANPELEIVVPAANQAFATDRLGLAPERLRAIDDGQSTQLAGFTIHGVPAAHETVERDDEGHCRFLGYVIEAGPCTLYHSGDTLRYDSQVDRLKPFNVDVALLPINGRDPSRGVAGNLNGRQAAALAKDIGASVAIPCHYEMFEFNTADPSSFVAECDRLDQRSAVLRCGERYTLDGK